MVGEMESVAFNINGDQHQIKCADYIGVNLAKYVREVALLTGTKISCGEGGCGACIVTVAKFEGDAPRSVNSCLTPVLSCDGWTIITVEGLGGKNVGYHPIQQALAAAGGSQCGYCSPGMVMQLHSYLQENPQATMLEIDNILDGNICRCTGYRPILDAFKTFGSDAQKNLSSIIADIEDLSLKGLCKRTGAPCPGAGQCASSTSHCKSSGGVETGSPSWLQPSSLEELQQILGGLSADTKYRLVGGNTSTGIYKNEVCDLFISINKVAELKETSTDPMFIGANVSITDAIHFFAAAGQNNPIWTAISKHLSWIASVGIRNQGTLAGNLMIKNAHNDFPSDVFITMETVGATVEIIKPDGSIEELTVGEFITTDMNRKFIRRINFPSLQNKTMKKNLHNLWLNSSKKKDNKETVGAQWVIRTFKIMPRSSNAHAYVNAGFLALVDKEDNFKIQQKPTVVFGGINPNFIHAKATEEFLIGRNMNDHQMFLEALTILAEEILPDEVEVLASTQYRRQLAMGLFYKFFLHVLGDSASPQVQSGAANLERGLSKGEQSYETDESQWPVSQPVEKLEAKYQTSGEAEYVGDIPFKQGELHAAFVLSSRANCDVASVNTQRALAVEGVVDFVDANDVPGFNGWKFAGGDFGGIQEEIFSTGKSPYAGQAVGLIVATDRETALKAARAVEVEYSTPGTVVVDMEKAMQTPSNISDMGGAEAGYGDVDNAMATADKVIQGRFKMGSQYHFHLETHVAIVTPIEDGFEVEVPTQDVNGIQTLVATVLNVPANSINTTVRRLGGSYGAKIVLPNHIATAAAVAANKLRKPVRLWVPLEDNMKMFGKRNPYLFDYKIGLDKDGKILAVESSLYCDGGWSMNPYSYDVDSPFAIVFGQSCYNIPNLRFKAYGVRTDTACPTATRAPGMCNGHAMIEAIMQHAAIEMGVSPMDLRMSNLMKQGDPILSDPGTLTVPSPIPEMIQSIMTTSDFAARKSALIGFNMFNRWKKRGLSMVPMRFDHNLGFHAKMNCLISVFAADGSVSVAHNGIEMGQGINTKVAQVVAFELGIPLSLVQVKPVTNLTNPNGSLTGGSFGSEANCMAAISACQILKERLTPIRKKLGTDATWQEIVGDANANGVDLCARYQYDFINDNFPGYSIWGVSVTEVEVDILTGEMYIVRADVLEDAGLSTSPQVDIGQVEGAFCMGLGLWTSEEIKHSPITGELLTHNTWEYKPPAAKDIPQDMRVSLLSNARNPLGCLGSKATGEPALLMSISVLFAIWDALNSSRMDGGQSGWWQLNGPATVEHIHQHAGVTPDQFVF